MVPDYSAFVFALIFLMIGETMAGVLVIMVFMTGVILSDIRWVMGFVFLIFILIRKLFKVADKK